MEYRIEKAKIQIQDCIKTKSKSLDLSYCELTTLEEIPKLLECTHINKLYLNHNQLIDINALKGLKQLNSLDISFNNLTDINALKELKQLNNLDISFNNLTDINELNELKKLKTLYLNNNKLTDININALKELKKLKTLHLNNNKLTDISILKDLKQLTFLSLYSNQITSIPEFIFHRFKYNYYIIEGNPISNPPIEKIGQGREAILEWFKANRVRFKEIKILLVGEPEVGKTSLLKVLKEDTFNSNEPQTDGINIVDIDFEKNQPNTFANQTKLHGVKARFWDFGGQEILSATHKLFFTSRSLYILLFNAREDTNIEKKVRDRIREIKSGGGDSPILVVANQIDVNPGFEFINTHELQKEFPQIKGFLKISCATSENIEELKNALEELIPNAGFLNSEVSQLEMDLKSEIAKLTKKKDFIDEREFNKISEKVGLISSDSRTNAIDFLDKVGLALYFSKIKMSRFYVLDPNWVTTALYRIITSKRASEQKGIVYLSDFDYILNDEREKLGKDYHPFTNKNFKYECDDERNFLSQILVVYKLAFERSKNEFILPNLLDGNPSVGLLETFEKEETLELIYDYGKIPANIITQIIVDLSNNNLSEYWRTGCVITNSNCEALIQSYNNRIEIKVKGTENRARRDLMIYITAVIEIINKDLPQPPVKLIPLPNLKDEYVKYQKLINRQTKGKKYYIHNEDLDNEQSFDIGILLDGIPTELEMEKMIRILNGKMNTLLDNTEEIKGTLKEYLIKINKQNQQIKDKITPEITSISEKIQKDIYNDMFKFISEIVTNQDTIDEKLDNIYEKLQSNDNVVSSKLELAVPFINVLGVTYKKEIDLKKWKEKMLEKYKLPLFNLFGYVKV